jgi:hypothetical protein
LNGLAVSDTEKIREKAETLTLVARVRILKGANIDRIMQELFEPEEMKEGMLNIYPNRRNSLFIRNFMGLTTLRSVSHFIITKRHLREKPKSTEEKLTVLEEKFDLRLKEMQEILNKIVTGLRVENERHKTLKAEKNRRCAYCKSIPVSAACSVSSYSGSVVKLINR